MVYYKVLVPRALEQELQDYMNRVAEDKVIH